MADFGDRKSVAFLEPVAHLVDHASFVFQASTAWNADRQSNHTDPDRFVGGFEPHMSVNPTEHPTGLCVDGFHSEHLEVIADLDIVEACQIHTAFVSLLDFLDVVFEPTQ